MVMPKFLDLVIALWRAFRKSTRQGNQEPVEPVKPTADKTKGFDVVFPDENKKNPS
jgi:hypothetical protein